MPIWAQILVPVLTAVATLIATSVTTHILNGPKRRREEREEEIRSIISKIDSLNKSIDERITQSYNDSNLLKDDITLLKMGLQAIIKNDLKVRYEHWIDEGYAPLDAKEDLERMYQIYHKLGANGVMDGMRKIFMNLPTEPKNK